MNILATAITGALDEAQVLCLKHTMSMLKFIPGRDGWGPFIKLAEVIDDELSQGRLPFHPFDQLHRHLNHIYTELNKEVFELRIKLDRRGCDTGFFGDLHDVIRRFSSRMEVRFLM